MAVTILAYSKNLLRVHSSRMMKEISLLMWIGGRLIRGALIASQDGFSGWAAIIMGRGAAVVKLFSSLVVLVVLIWGSLWLSIKLSTHRVLTV